MKRGSQSNQLSDEAEKPTLMAVWRFLKPYMSHHWRSGVVGAILIILSSLLIFPGPLINKFLVDDVILAKRLDLLPWAILLYGSIRIFSMGANVMQEYYLLSFQQAVMLDLQKNLLDHTLHLPKAYFDQKEVGYLISRISSDLHGLNWFFSGIFVHLLTNLIRFIGGVFFVFYLEWRLALITLVFLPFFMTAVKFFSKHIRALGQQGMEQNATIMKHLQETISSIPLIKAFTSEKRESDRVMNAYQVGRQLTMESSVLGSFANLVINFVPELAKGIVFVVGTYLAIMGDWTLGSLFAFESYLGYVYGPATFMANMNLRLQNSLVALERVSALFNIVPEDNLESGKTAEKIKGAVSFEKVSFSYGSEENILENLSFHIQPGERVAIVGPSGVGKTTLISLLLCFYKPTDGEILFDDLPASSYNLPSLRRRIGYVSQSTMVFSGTIAENLSYGHPDATQEEIEKASIAAGIHDYILGLPQGYYSKIHERGVNLSEGQKQRLSIARALIKEPDILILDEPTSALDSIVERSIFSSLPAYIRGKTLFVVAHRLVTIQDSDRILLLNEKQLLAMGTHQELLTQNEFYQALVANQTLDIPGIPY